MFIMWKSKLINSCPDSPSGVTPSHPGENPPLYSTPPIPGSYFHSTFVVFLMSPFCASSGPHHLLLVRFQPSSNQSCVCLKQIPCHYPAPNTITSFLVLNSTQIPSEQGPQMLSQPHLGQGCTSYALATFTSLFILPVPLDVFLFEKS